MLETFCGSFVLLPAVKFREIKLPKIRTMWTMEGLFKGLAKQVTWLQIYQGVFFKIISRWGVLPRFQSVNYICAPVLLFSLTLIKKKNQVGGTLFKPSAMGANRLNRICCKIRIVLLAGSKVFFKVNGYLTISEYFSQNSSKLTSCSCTDHRQIFLFSLKCFAFIHRTLWSVTPIMQSSKVWVYLNNMM